LGTAVPVDLPRPRSSEQLIDDDRAAEVRSRVIARLTSEARPIGAARPAAREAVA
jgi:hypothetical protein